MKKYSLPAIALIFAFASCTDTDKKSGMNANNSFTTYKQNVIMDLLKRSPSFATSQGLHDYDSILVIPTNGRKLEDIAFSKAQLDSLSKFNIDSLNDVNKTDYELLKNQFESSVWRLEQFNEAAWNASDYNPGSNIAEILNYKQHPLAVKIKNIVAKMKHFKEYYDVAKANLTSPTKEHTELAVQQLKGSVGFYATSLKDSIKKATPLKEEADKQLAVVDSAIAATNGFVGCLEGLLSNKDQQWKSCRIGKELHAQKFKYDIQSGLTAGELYDKALKRKAELLVEMYKLADKLWPKYLKEESKPADSTLLISKVINEIAKTHVKPADFQKEIERQIPILTAFVKERNLLYMDPSKPLVVRKEPEWMAGVAGASISAPGPFDKGGDTYYNVGSLAAYSPEEAESFLREYNKYVLQILNIHEAIPGHYAQLVYANQSPSLVKSVLGNGAMIEGWAVYTERMMLEEGWAKNTSINGAVEEDEMWLFYYKWHMRVVCNTILDYSVHELNMSKEDGLKLLMQSAFQEKAEAEGKWRRATLTQVQLCSYFNGYSEIFDLREEHKKRLADKFDLKAFHEKFLSYGSAPVKQIRMLMEK